MNEAEMPGNFLPTPLSKVKNEDDPYYLPTTQDGRGIYSCKNWDITKSNALSLIILLEYCNYLINVS